MPTAHPPPPVTPAAEAVRGCVSAPQGAIRRVLAINVGCMLGEGRPLDHLTGHLALPLLVLLSRGEPCGLSTEALRALISEQLVARSARLSAGGSALIAAAEDEVDGTPWANLGRQVIQFGFGTLVATLLVEDPEAAAWLSAQGVSLSAEQSTGLTNDRMGNYHLGALWALSHHAPDAWIVSGELTRVTRALVDAAPDTVKARRLLKDHAAHGLLGRAQLSDGALAELSEAWRSALHISEVSWLRQALWARHDDPRPEVLPERWRDPASTAKMPKNIREVLRASRHPLSDRLVGGVQNVMIRTAADLRRAQAHLADPGVAITRRASALHFHPEATLALMAQTLAALCAQAEAEGPDQVRPLMRALHCKLPGENVWKASWITEPVEELALSQGFYIQAWGLDSATVRLAAQAAELPLSPGTGRRQLEPTQEAYWVHSWLRSGLKVLERADLADLNLPSDTPEARGARLEEIARACVALLGALQSLRARLDQNLAPESPGSAVETDLGPRLSEACVEAALGGEPLLGVLTRCLHAWSARERAALDFALQEDGPDEEGGA